MLERFNDCKSPFNSNNHQGIDRSGDGYRKEEVFRDVEVIGEFIAKQPAQTMQRHCKADQKISDGQVDEEVRSPLECRAPSPEHSDGNGTAKKNQNALEEKYGTPGLGGFAKWLPRTSIPVGHYGELSRPYFPVHLFSSRSSWLVRNNSENVCASSLCIHGDAATLTALGISGGLVEWIDFRCVSTRKTSWWKYSTCKDWTETVVLYIINIYCFVPLMTFWWLLRRV